MSDDEQCELRNLMLDYLSSQIDNTQNGVQKYPIVDMHTNPPFGSFVNFHNYAEEFATWHRNYIQGMEEYILSQGYPQYIPLPYWTPHEAIPDAFYNYKGCDGTYANLPEEDDFPQYTNGQGPFAPSSNINFTMFDQELNCENWNNVDEFISYIEGNPPGTTDFNFNHNATHSAVGGTLGPPQLAPASTLFWLFHAYITDLHSCYLRECEGEEADIYIRDNAADNGSVPTIQPNELWTSPDIWVRNNPDGFENTSVEKLCFKLNDNEEVRPVYIYVRTWNRGNVPSKNNENDIKVYWAKPSAGLSWPAPWDGQPIAGVCNLPVGGFVGAQALRSVNGRYFDEFDVDRDGDNTETIEGYTIYEFEWLPPDPSLYVDCFGSGWEKGHFCIHARVDDGNSWNLSGDFYNDLVINNDFALKNIYIYGEDDENELCDEIEWLAPSGEDCILFGNYTDKIMNNVSLELSFPTIEDELPFLNHEFIMSLKDDAMVRWNEGGRIGEGVNYIEGDNAIKFTAMDGKIEGLTLEPMQIYRFCIEVIGDSAISVDEDFEFDIIQKVNESEVGGERFIVKKTKLPIEQRAIKNNTDINIAGYKVYPNPSGTQFTVKLNNWSDDHNITIINSLGQIVLNLSNIIGKKVISANEIGSGIFSVKIENNITGDIIIQKVIIEQ